MKILETDTDIIGSTKVCSPYKKMMDASKMFCRCATKIMVRMTVF